MFRVQLNSFSKPLSFSSELVLDLASTTVAPCSLFPPSYPCRTITWRLAGVGDEQEEVCHPVSDGSSGFAAARERRSMDGAVQRRQATGGRRVATHSPVRVDTLVVNC